MCVKIEIGLRRCGHCVLGIENDVNPNVSGIVAGNCTGATFRVNLDICLEGRTNAIKYSGLLALTKRLSNK